jgi:hypothetical protein
MYSFYYGAIPQIRGRIYKLYNRAFVGVTKVLMDRKAWNEQYKNLTDIFNKKYYLYSQIFLLT